MTLEEIEREADQIAAKRADRRTPSVVRRAFLPPFCALTLRKYIALEECNSPLLNNSWSWDDAAAMAQEFCNTFAIFYPDTDFPKPAKVPEAVTQMAEELFRAFNAFMPVRLPSELRGNSVSSSSDGIGWTARLIAHAITNNISQPLDRPLDQLFILTAAADVNSGKECAGEEYQDRETSLNSLGKTNGTTVATEGADQGSNAGGKESHDQESPAESSSNPSSGNMVKAGQDQADRRSDAGVGGTAHEGTIA